MASPRTKSSTPKLSKVARHVIQPAGIKTTAWPSVRDRSRDMGITYDTWQSGLGQLILAKRESGLYAAGIGGVVISIPRQVGKTFTIGSIIFALCTLLSGLTVIWTAHRTRTHNETFNSMKAMALRKRIAPFIGKIRSVNGEQEIGFKNGSRILFGARESGFGRGFAEVDILVLDEAQILSENAMEDMVPATNAAPNGLVIMMGTPPRPKDPGEVFTSRRRDALSGDTETLYVEISADEDANPDDRRQWRKANPSYPHRVTEGAILRMRKLLGSEESFKREGLGIWDKELAGETAITRKQWDVLLSTVPEDGRDCFGVRFSADGAEVALAAARRPNDGPVFIEGIRSSPLSDGTMWLVDFLAERKDTAAQFVIDGKSGVGYLVNALRDAGVRNKRLIITPTLDQVIAAHSMFLQGVKAGGLSHSGQRELNDQVYAALTRKIGNNGGFGWESPEGGSVTLMEAATLAFWGAKTTRRRGGRKTMGMVMS